MKLRVGLALASAVDDTNVIITKLPADEVTITCGGVPMVAKGEKVPEATPDPEHMTGSIMGKRYVDSSGSLEVLCTKPGQASLAANGALLVTAEAKPLPASD
ncbi:hypothetical protein [Gordonia liuliyuniae]|uniref:Uncharacterized protein n=1 Tax=Gordonia liuliyuniae TaxID=2911517 RepID=A0ABS9IP09_9ACTN|nr:hypothetical protein [Gordonia liuliyuniae]MCF8587306.1 hypothetical protein [Gordonia liuliyuniae]